MKTYRYIVKGLVQGVGYRFFVNITAEKLEIKGSVKNLDSGDVEVLAQGEERVLKDFERYLKIGPSFSKVTEVEKSEVQRDEFKTFKTIY